MGRLRAELVPFVEDQLPPGPRLAQEPAHELRIGHEPMSPVATRLCRRAPSSCQETSWANCSGQAREGHRRHDRRPRAVPRPRPAPSSRRRSRPARSRPAAHSTRPARATMAPPATSSGSSTPTPTSAAATPRATRSFRTKHVARAELRDGAGTDALRSSDSSSFNIYPAPSPRRTATKALAITGWNRVPAPPRSPRDFVTAEAGAERPPRGHPSKPSATIEEVRGKRKASPRAP